MFDQNKVNQKILCASKFTSPVNHNDVNDYFKML